MWNLRTKKSEQTKLKQTHRLGEQTDDYQRAGGLGGLGGKGEGNKKYRSVVTK